MTELKLYSTIAVQPAVEILVPRFERGWDCRIAVTWNTAPALVKRLRAGESGDVLLLNLAGIEAMAAAGRLVAGSPTPLASSATAIAIKAGGKRPDISSPEALKQSLLQAKSISYTRPEAGGAS